MKKVCLITLGCSKNLVDSEHILGLLQYDGYEITTNMDEADLIVVNTCGFIEPSKRESIEAIFNALNSGKQVVVSGCLVERYEKELKAEIPEVASFIPIHNYDSFNEFLTVVDPNLPDKYGLRDELRILSTKPYSAYLKIGEGCSNRCAYCAIPLIRGNFKSRPMKDIIDEAKKLASNGVKEIIILEQDTTMYGIDLSKEVNIVSLMKELVKIEGIEYIRLLYLYPDEITDELIDMFANEKKVLPYFDVPIQHSETALLRSMRRRSTRESLLELFKRIREKCPKAVFRTTLMVGFPGEKEEDVDNLVNFINEVEIDHIGCFTYSREEGTASYDYPNQIEEEVKVKRKEKVMKAAQSVSYKLNKKHVGEIMEGMIVGIRKNEYLFRSYWNAPDDVDGNIYVKSDRPLKEGENVKVLITEAYVYDLIGKVVE